jgi:hypothetical protein
MTSNKEPVKPQVKTNEKQITQHVNSAKKTTIDLEKLKKDYSLQLSAYKQAVADYTSYLQQNANKKSNKSLPNYIVIPGKKFWGTGQAGAQSVYNGVTVEKCKALCASNSKCNGATFSPDANGKSTCWLRRGEGELTPALDTDKAIIPEAQKYLLTIESVNKKLIQTNEQIQKIIKQSTPLYNTIKTEGSKQNKELIQNYSQLISEREKIEKMLEKYQDLDETEKEGGIKITQNYYSYILLVAITIGAVILLYKFSGIFTNDENSYSQNSFYDDAQPSTNKYYIILIIIILILVINSYTTIKSTASNVSNGTYDSLSSIFSSISGIFSSRY